MNVFEPAPPDFARIEPSAEKHEIDDGEGHDNATEAEGQHVAYVVSGKPARASVSVSTIRSSRRSGIALAPSVLA